MEAKFEYVGEDIDQPNAKIYKVEAIHVSTTRNRRKFTKAELEAGARSLSFRPLNINHEESRGLKYPENSTRAMHFNVSKMAVEGTFRVTDPIINAMIETGRINSVSIEQIPTLGESCNEIICEQHGVAFIGLALLESDVSPGDPKTINTIKKESISDLFIEDAQRECVECTDEIRCLSCTHQREEKIEMQKKIEHLAFKWMNAGAPLDKSITASIERYAPEPKDAKYYYDKIISKFN